MQQDTSAKVDLLFSSILQKFQDQVIIPVPVPADDNSRNSDLDSQQANNNIFSSSSEQSAKNRESNLSPGTNQQFNPFQDYYQQSSSSSQHDQMSLKAKLSQLKAAKISSDKKCAFRAPAPASSKHTQSESILQNSEPLPTLKYKVGQLPPRSEASNSQAKALILDAMNSYAPKLIFKNPRNGRIQLDFKSTQSFLTSPANFIKSSSLPTNWDNIISLLRREHEKWNERNKEINYFFTNATEKIKTILQMRLDETENIHDEIIQTIKSIRLIEKDTLSLWASEFQTSLFRFDDVHHIRLICVSWTNDVVTEFSRKFTPAQMSDESFNKFQLENNPEKRQQYESDLEQLIACVDKLPIKTPFMWGLLVSISICYQIQSLKTWDFLGKLGDKLFSKSKESMTFNNIIGLPQEIKILASCYKKLEGELSKYNENTTLEEIKPQLISFFVFTLYKQRSLSPVIDIQLPESVNEAKRYYLEKKYSHDISDPLSPRDGYGIIPEKQQEIYSFNYGVSK